MRIAVALLVLSLPAVGESNPKVELGRRLFMDRTVSKTGRVSCSSCHLPEHGFGDPRVFSEDEAGDTLRHSQAILDVADGRPLHWDGEFGSVRELLVARLAPSWKSFPLFREIRRRKFEAAKAAGRHPDESAFRESRGGYGGGGGGPTGPDRARSAKPGWSPAPVPLLLRLGEDDRYRPAFQGAFGSPKITSDRIIEALEAYVLSLRSGENALDRHLAGDTRALTAGQKRGLALFTGKANCGACHHWYAPPGARPRLTDSGFHNTGVAFTPVEYAEDEEPTLRRILLEIARDGAGNVNFVREDCGKFKTPSLRDVARRAPYMHDGSLKTLEDVVRYYDRGGTPNQRLDERIRPLGLTDAEVSDLVAFLGALTGDERAGIGPLPPRGDRIRVRVVDLRGKPLAGLRVEIQPAGDRLEGASMDDEPQYEVTDRSGDIAFRFPKWTHVRLSSTTHEIHYDWLIPDCAPRMEVMAAPRDTVALKLTMADSCPDSFAALWAGSEEVIACFRLVRRFAPGRAIYVAERRPAATPWASARWSARWRGRTARELDLSGGWTDPIDERRDPGERPTAGCGTGLCR